MTNSILKYCFLLISLFLMNTNIIRAEKYKIHDLDRPKPNIINVGNFSQNALPPSDAIILFNGNGLDEWKSTKGKNVKWKSTPDYFEAKKGTGSIITKKSFGDLNTLVKSSNLKPKPRPNIIKANMIGAILVTISIYNSVNLEIKINYLL